MSLGFSFSAIQNKGLLVMKKSSQIFIPTIVLCLSIASVSSAETKPVKHHKEVPRFVDLSQDPKSNEGLPLPGIEMSACGGCAPSKGYLLPLELELQSLTPIDLSKTAPAIAVIRLRNIGEEVFRLPVARSWTIHKKNSSGKRIFNFIMEFDDLESAEKIQVFSAVTYSADLTPKSYISVRPGSQVLLRIAIHTNQEYSGQMGGGHTQTAAQWISNRQMIAARAGCSEQMIKRDAYITNGRSEPVFSINTIRVQVE